MSDSEKTGLPKAVTDALDSVTPGDNNEPVSHGDSGRFQTSRSWDVRPGKLVLNKSFQAKHIAIVALISCVVTGFVGYLMWKQDQRGSASMIEKVAEDKAVAASPEDARLAEEIARQIQEQLEASKRDLIETVAIVGVGLIVVLSVFLLAFSALIARPLKQIARHLSDMKYGRLRPVSSPGHFNMMREFYLKFESMHAALRDRAHQDNKAIEAFLGACADANVERDGALGHQLDTLERHVRARNKALGSD